jgi:hypothetical protein
MPATLTGAHQSATCLWLSIFLTCKITLIHYARNNQKSSKIIYNVHPNVHANWTEKPCMGNIKALNLAVVRPMTVEVTD